MKDCRHLQGLAGSRGQELLSGGESALFAMEGAQGRRIFFHYPRLQAMGGAMEANSSLEGRTRSSGGGTLERVLLGGEFRALPVTDPLDGERVVCYRSFLPAGKALI